MGIRSKKKSTDKHTNKKTYIKPLKPREVKQHRQNNRHTFKQTDIRSIKPTQIIQTDEYINKHTYMHTDKKRNVQK